MGLLDLFKVGKVLVGTAKAVQHQRNVAAQVRALPMAQFVPRCLQGMHSLHVEWKATPRPPCADAHSVAAAKRLPLELADFYAQCDGFESTEDFPARVLSLGELKLGADFEPQPSKLVEAFWAEHGNDSAKQGCLAILPPDNLTALMSNSAECFIRPNALDMMVPIVPPTQAGFALVLLTAMGERLPAGTVLEYENGSATRFDGFKHWLATRGTLMAAFER
ncbi:MAG TPA: hypothetical protein VLJ58_22490 [Ramlibacter sp.]|nr:hypothetical protein [Ramlibacter sp.]